MRRCSVRAPGEICLASHPCLNGRNRSACVPLAATVVQLAEPRSLKAPIDTAPPPILVVDDEPLVLRALCQMLNKDCPTLGVTTLREAHDYLMAHAVTALVLDVHLVEGFGWEVLVAAREHDPMLPALVITGQSWKTLAEQARAAHALVCEKPTDAEDLRAFVQYALALRRTGPVLVSRLVSELRDASRLSRREARFVEYLLLGRPQDDPRQTLEKGVLAKTGRARLSDVRASVLEAFFAHGHPFRGRL
jgi:CheY-like chemotaxis protein